MIMLEIMLKAATTMIKVKNQKHDVAFNLDRVEQARIGLLPIDNSDMAIKGGVNCARLLPDAIGIGNENLQITRGIGNPEEYLRRFERYVDIAIVVFIHADRKQCDDVVGLEARHCAERSRGSLRRNYGDPAADPDAEALRQPVTNGNPVIAEICERTANDPAGDKPQRA